MHLTRAKLFPPFVGAFCLLSAVFWFIISFPGILVGDNISMLVEALPGGSIGDQHSVMFIWLLRLSNELFGYHIYHPLLWGVVWWHLGVFFYTISLFRYTKSYWSLSVSLAFSLAPCISFIIPHLPVKDFMMSAVYLASSGLLLFLWLQRSKYLIGSILILSLFFFALTLRHNAIFAFIPFSIVITIYASSHFGFRIANRPSNLFLHLAVSLVIVIGLFVSRNQFDAQARDYKNYFVHSSIFLFDLAGISIQTGELRLPKDILEDGIVLEDLKIAYNHAGWDPLWGGWGNEKRIIKNNIDKEEYNKILRLWLSTIANNPIAYFNHRASHFNKFIYWRNNYAQYAPWSPDDGWQILYNYTPDYLKEKMLKSYKKKDFEVINLSSLSSLEGTNSVLSKKIGKWFYSIAPHYCLKILLAYVTITIILCVVVFKFQNSFSVMDKKILIFALVLFFSGFIYFLSYFIVSVSSDWRYIHWSHLSMWIGLALLLSFIFKSDMHKVINSMWSSRKD